MQLAESRAVIKARGGCTAGSGPDLTGYPHLTHAPAQWGDGVRIASNGAAVKHVAEHVDELPITIVAGVFDITIEAAADAYRYAKANGLI